MASMYAVALLSELIKLGVRHIVLCPGSRSQALALAAAEAERVGAVDLHVRTDERSAAFFALGIARETGVPAPVIVTSGTAVANLLPAALEAHEGRVPLLLLTADRPRDLRGIRSNQTTRQAGILGLASRWSIDVDVAAGEHGASQLAQTAMAAALGAVGKAPAGPVQLNLAFREPLSGWPAGVEVDLGAGPMSAAQMFTHAVKSRAHADERTRIDEEPDDVYVHDDDALSVVVAGDGAGAEAEEFARSAGLPLLAEVVSGSRYGREAISAYAALIDDAEIGGLTERAIVFGHPTLSRQIPALLGRSDVEVIVVDPYVDIDHYNPSRSAHIVRSARVADAYAPTSMHRWLGAWVVADRKIRAERTTVHEPDLDAARATGYKERSAYARAEVAVLREPVTRELLAESVWRATWPHDRLFLAASRLVRVLDEVAPPRAVGVRSNRGLAGIDGTIATAMGVAVASQSHSELAQAAGTTRVLLGDLAMAHDVGSLLLPEAETRPRIQLFVGNDGGGTIFDTLEAASTSPADAFDRVMYTPQRIDLRALAEAYGWDYLRVESRGHLERMLTAPVTGPVIVDVPLSR